MGWAGVCFLSFTHSYISAGAFCLQVILKCSFGRIVPRCKAISGYVRRFLESRLLHRVLGLQLPRSPNTIFLTLRDSYQIFKSQTLVSGLLPECFFLELF